MIRFAFRSRQNLYRILLRYTARLFEGHSQTIIPFRRRLVYLAGARPGTRNMYNRAHA